MVLDSSVGNYYSPFRFAIGRTFANIEPFPVKLPENLEAIVDPPLVALIFVELPKAPPQRLLYHNNFVVSHEYTALFWKPLSPGPIATIRSSFPVFRNPRDGYRDLPMDFLEKIPAQIS